MTSLPRIARALVVFALAAFAAAPASAEPILQSTHIVSGLVSPTFVTAAPGDTTRLFVLEQYTGRVRIVDMATHTLRPRPFLTVSGLPPGEEQGLLGLAFHPNFPATPWVFVDYNDTTGATVVKRFTLSPNPDSLDATSGTTLFVAATTAGFHNAGWIGFGPDGYLYVAIGDGGRFGDMGPGHDPLVGNAQSDTTRRGKILRLDVNASAPYGIPPSNPFAGAASPKNEYWAKGVRNPWRCAFDRATGDFYVADVGQDKEEVDFQPAGFAGGANYGWRKFESWWLWNCPTPCDSSGLTRPILGYDHSSPDGPCALIGGAVYRGSAVPGLAGEYFFADYCSNQVWTLRVLGGVATDVRDRKSELVRGAGSNIHSITSFGEDARGELYFLTRFDGELWRIDHDPVGVGVAPATSAALALGTAVPNPSGHGFRFRIAAREGEPVALRVYDANGRLVRAVWSGAPGPIGHDVAWDGRDGRGVPVRAGLYLAKLEARSEAMSRKLTLVR